MTEQEYNQAEGIRRSDLTRLQRSPAHARYAMEHPAEPTPALVFGTAVHAYILQPEEFTNQFRVTDVDMRTKEGKALKAEAAEKGITLLNSETFGQIESMAEAIKANPYATRLLTGEHETSHFWTDPETGEKCKCRTDCETDIAGVHYIVDLKTCANASTEEFTRDALKYGYFIQAAMYTEGVKADTGKDSVFVFVAVEKEPPYAVNVLQCGEDVIRIGMNGNGKTMGYRALMDLYHKCRTEDRWPGYEGFDNAINEISIPRWRKEEPEKPEEQKAEVTTVESVSEVQTEKKYITVKELAELLGVSVNTAYAMTRKPEFPWIKVSPRAIRIVVDDLNGWLKKYAANKH